MAAVWPEAAFRLRNEDAMSGSSDKKDRKFMARWIGFGVASGCAIGIAIGNLALGIGPGVAIGVLIGTLNSKSRR